MVLAEEIFGKPWSDIFLEDLKDFFEEAKEESPVLEFKSGEVTIFDLFKEICAFLNTDGGVLIVGAPREKKIVRNNRSVRICQGKLMPSGFKNKNWIEQRIAIHIYPFPRGIMMKGYRDENGSYYIIDVPKSPDPPHQFIDDGRYYIRVQDEARPAPHEIVKSLFLKNEKPVVSSDITLEQDTIENRVNVNLCIENLSNIPLDGFHYKTDVINVDTIAMINGKPFWDKGKHHFVLDYMHDGILLNEMKYEARFQIIHKFQPFVFYILAWGNDVGLFKRGIMYDPSNNIKLLDTSASGRIPDLKEMKRNLNELLHAL